MPTMVCRALSSTLLMDPSHPSNPVDDDNNNNAADSKQQSRRNEKKKK